jgi:hypothetical protein
MRLSLIVAVAALTTLAFTAKADRFDFFSKSFFTGNDVYQRCQNDRPFVLGYTAGLADSATHTMWILESMRPLEKTMRPKESILLNSTIDFDVEFIAAYCRPPEATLNQITDVFCKYLRDTPEERDGLPAILFNDAMTKAWPCS